MIKIDITIPLFYNNGKPVESKKFDKIKREILSHFNGLSISDNIGYWLHDKKQYKDKNRVYSIICQGTKDDLSWINSYKKWLMNSLKQHSIFIVLNKCEVI